MTEHPAYGVPRLAMHLNVSENKISRIKNINKLVVARIKSKRWFKPKDFKQAETKYPNLLENLVLTKVNQAYASDFTYIKHKGKFLYLATVIDIYSREIKGFSLGSKHNTNLVKSALCDALSKSTVLPDILHSDQGSEYRSESYTRFTEAQGIKISMSKKSSPWQNGFQESFYGSFKTDLGDPNRFNCLGELQEAIYKTIYYYNNHRIHTALKTSPVQFAKHCLANC